MNFKIQDVTCFVTAQQALWQKARFCLLCGEKLCLSVLPSSPAFTWSVSLGGYNICAMPGSARAQPQGWRGSHCVRGMWTPCRAENSCGLRLLLVRWGELCLPGNQRSRHCNHVVQAFWIIFMIVQFLQLCGRRRPLLISVFLVWLMSSTYS